jgi:hypothetical protein
MPTTTTLKAYREDGTEVHPGDTITMTGIDLTFRSATVASNDRGTGGMIDTVRYPGLYTRPFGLTVRAVDEPAWHSAGTGIPAEIRRNIAGPGGFWAFVGPDAGMHPWNWRIIDSSDGETVTSGTAWSLDDAKQAVLDWERPGPVPGTLSDRSEPDPLREALAACDREEDGALTGLYHAVRAQLEAPSQDAAELAADAEHDAQRMAPPVPGVTQNMGCTVYAVLDAGPGSWWVAARRESDGERVTWFAKTCPGGTLAYSAGHYHTRGQSSDDEARADLADRAGVFSALDRLTSGAVTREIYRQSYQAALTELNENCGVGRARVREALLEAAALGSARVTWHRDGPRTYGICYDRYRCTFSWRRES